MEPLLVTAHLQHGYVARDRWSPSLDGILAAMALREQLGDEEYALGMTGHRPLVEVELPLEKATDDWTWWWVCSAPIAGDLLAFRAWFHRRFDDQYAYDRVPERVRTVQTKGGAYKAYRNADTVRIPDGGMVSWHCVGDRAEIERLLRRCQVVGAGGSRGRGMVRGWSVSEGDERIARTYRPLPLEYALELGLTGAPQQWGIRPPGRVPEHQLLCLMP